MASFHHFTIFFIAILTSIFAITATSQFTYLFTTSPSSTAFSVSAAINHLNKNGYVVLARAMHFRYYQLITLNNMTIFALDDLSVEHNRPDFRYLHDVKRYIVPNRLLKFADLQKLPEFTAFPTLIRGEYLYITDAGDGDGGVFSPMKATRINYNVIDQPDFIISNKVVVHGIALPFVRVNLNSSSNPENIDDEFEYVDAHDDEFDEFGYDDEFDDEYGYVDVHDEL